MTLKRTVGPKPSAFKRPERKEASAVKKLRLRKCAVKSCRAPFEPRSTWAQACSPECAAIVAQQKREADERKADKAKLIEMKPLKWWRKKAKTSMHSFVRVRDEGKPCASCDTLLLKLGRMGGDYDAGHFRPVGLAKHLEFDIRNIWGQCKYCNDRLRGNFQAYEQRLRLREGDAFVDELLADNEPRHLKIHDYQEIEATYKAKLKEIRK
jgi:hypothetical protein